MHDRYYKRLKHQVSVLNLAGWYIIYRVVYRTYSPSIEPSDRAWYLDSFSHLIRQIESHAGHTGRVFKLLNDHSEVRQEGGHLIAIIVLFSEYLENIDTSPSPLVWLNLLHVWPNARMRICTVVCPGACRHGEVQ